MADSGRTRPPWWLTPMDKVFMAGMRTGVMAEDTPDEFEALARRCAVYRFDPVA